MIGNHILWLPPILKIGALSTEMFHPSIIVEVDFIVKLDRKLGYNLLRIIFQERF